MQGVLQADMAQAMALQSQAQGAAKSLSNAPVNTPDEIKEVAAEFESLFMHMMLKSMRSATRAISEGNMFNSFETRMYEDMLDEKLAVSLSKTHGIGIADLLIQQLSPKALKKDYGLGESGLNADQDSKAINDIPRTFQWPRITMPESAQAYGPEPAAASTFTGPKEFVQTLLPKAKAVAKELGVAVKHIVAQAALETGWGQHMMTGANGQNSFNLFGIKAGSDWQGKTVSALSLEVRDGVAAKERSQFRAYKDLEESINDYGRFIKDRSRYEEVLNSGGDIDKFGSALKSAGYATDPNYDKKLKAVLQHDAFKGIADEELL